MSSSSSSSSSVGGIGFLGVLQVAFIVLKLTGFIDWSWWLVMAPMIFGVSIWLIVVGFIVWLFTRR